MTTVQILLIIAVVSASAFVGIICAMAGVIQWMLNGLGYAEYRLAMQGIIVQGRKSVAVWLLLLTPITASAIAVWLLVQQGASPVLGLTAAGLTTYIAGAVLTSRFLNEPWYDRVMCWTPGHEPSNWQQARMQWFYFNLVRLGIGGVGSVPLAIALAIAV